MYLDNDPACKEAELRFCWRMLGDTVEQFGFVISLVCFQASCGGMRWMKRMRLAWAVLVIAAVLMVGCARGLSREEQGASPVDATQEAIVEANLAAEAVKAAAAKGDLNALRAAYEQFSLVFGKLLGPVSLEDPKVAQKMANANSTIKEMLLTGKVDKAAMAREVATIRQGLQESTTVMARAGGEPQADAKPATAGGTQGPAPMEQTFTVVGVDYRFQPPQLRVKKGTRVTIRFENRGTEEHEFELEAFDFEIGHIKPGQTMTKSFIASKAGVFSYECHVDGHLQEGMKGTLVVEE